MQSPRTKIQGQPYPILQMESACMDVSCQHGQKPMNKDVSLSQYTLLLHLHLQTIVLHGNKWCAYFLSASCYCRRLFAVHFLITRNPKVIVVEYMIHEVAPLYDNEQNIIIDTESRITSTICKVFKIQTNNVILYKVNILSPLTQNITFLVHWLQKWLVTMEINYAYGI